MPIEIIVPRLGWSMEEGHFGTWLKKDGEFVRAGELLFSLEGDKALQEIEAIDSGVLRLLPDSPQPGESVRVGELLGHLLTEKEAGRNETGLAPKARPAGEVPKVAAQKTVAARTATNEPPRADRGASEPIAISPRALRVAKEQGIDWSKVTGTGRDGRIRERDITAVSTARVQARNASGRVVITDWTFADLGIEEKILTSAGHELVARACKGEAELIALCRDADAVITQFAQVTEAVIAAMSKARVIVRYGIGVDNVDLKAARERGIPVCNVPDYCVDEVADQTLAFILALTRQIVPHDRHVHGGRWGLATPLAGFQALRDLTIGVVGFGRIGREVVRRLLPFNCAVLVFDPIVPSETIAQAGATAVTWANLLAQSDVLTLHCPSTRQTRKMISAEALAQMRRGACLVNVARGDLVDTPALVAALESGQINGAALDVCDPEPIPVNHPLLQLRQVILTPHVASCSVKAVTKLRDTVAQLVAAVLRGEAPRNVVNGVSKSRFH